MRFFIVGLSVVLFCLSAVIMFKALGLSVNEISSDGRQNVADKPTKRGKELTKAQVANQALIENLQETIAQLENQLARTENSSDKISDPRTERKKPADDSNKTEQVNEVESKDDNKSELVDNTEANVTKVSEVLVSKDNPEVLAVFGSGIFNSGRDAINNIDQSQIDGIVREILAYPESRIIIEGHTDNIPTKALTGMQYSDNMGLSLLRARAIANLLIRRGVSLDRMSVVGYGDTRPIASNNTEAGRAKNRRVEVKLLFD